MAETKPIPVRLEQTLRDRLDDVADRIGTNRAALMRFCVLRFLDYFEQHGKASLPLEYQEILRAQDNRTAASRNPIYYDPRPASAALAESASPAPAPPPKKPRRKKSSQ